jgi:transcription initiation factor TFIID subunit TAF12
VVAHAFNPFKHLGGRGRWISEFEASLVYRVSSRTAMGLHRETLSRKTKKQTKQQQQQQQQQQKTDCRPLSPGEDLSCELCAPPKLEGLE